MSQPPPRSNVGAFIVGDNMIELTKKYEGLSLKPYRCPAGYPTIGYGIRFYPDGREVKMSDPQITIDRAEALLRDYVIRNIIPKIESLNPTPSQTEALVSLIYNIGWNSFARSKCYKALKNHNWGEAFKEWNWITANGKVMKGLIKRRAEEIYMYFKDLK